MINKQLRYDTMYMDLAKRLAKMSYARRLQVGAVSVKNDRIISMGWNGMPSGFDNNCEIEIPHEWINVGTKEYGLEKIMKCKNCTQIAFNGEDNKNVICKLITRQEVLHAEQNLIIKLAKDGESALGSSIYITHSPCIDCAKLIFQCGFIRIIYDQEYRSNDGIEFLKKVNLEVIKL